MGAAGVRDFNVVQNYYAIQKQCLESGKLFEDPEFPPTGRWIRTKELCKNPKFMSGGFGKGDIKQGYLIGDCWFLAAAAALTKSYMQLFYVVPTDNQVYKNKTYAGIFHFR